MNMSDKQPTGWRLLAEIDHSLLALAQALRAAEPERLAEAVVMKLARPYPKRVESAAGGTPIPIGGGGSIPTSTLQINKDATRESDGAKWSELAKNSGLSQAKKSK